MTEEFHPCNWDFDPNDDTSTIIPNPGGGGSIEDLTQIAGEGLSVSGGKLNVTLDDALSDTSKNGVMNKVITQRINALQVQVNSFTMDDISAVDE